jgi:hypothetical protein
VKLHLIAFVERAPRVPLFGIDGPARFVRVGPGVVAAVEPRRRPAPATEHTFIAHDAAIRHLCEAVDAVVPARFAAPLEDERALRDAVAGRAAEISAALERVRGREQMSIRVLRLPASRTVPGRRRISTTVLPERGRKTSRRTSRRAAPSGPGRRFLEDRRETLLVPALDPVRRALTGLVREERIEPHTTPMLVATVHHLVDRGESDEYRRRVTAVLASGDAPLLAVRGPFPPYAFATPGDAS